MKKTLLITDLTRMQPPWVCVGGYWPDLTAVRPKIGRGLTEDYLFHDGRPIIRPFAEVELDFLRSIPHPPHTEDWFIDRGHKVLVRPPLPEEQAKAFLERILDPDVTSIFGAEVHTEFGCYVKVGEGTRSLGTIRPRNIASVRYAQRESGTWDYRITFVDPSGQEYRLAVTDLGFRYYCDARRRSGEKPQDIAADLMQRFRLATVFLRIGLARGWEKYPDRCYLQITGVYTFPDYLEGRCFADLNPEQGTEPAPPVSE